MKVEIIWILEYCVDSNKN